MSISYPREKKNEAEMWLNFGEYGWTIARSGFGYEDIEDESFGYSGTKHGFGVDILQILHDERENSACRNHLLDLLSYGVAIRKIPNLAHGVSIPLFDARTNKEMEQDEIHGNLILSDTDPSTELGNIFSPVTMNALRDYVDLNGRFDFAFSRGSGVMFSYLEGDIFTVIQQIAPLVKKCFMICDVSIIDLDFTQILPPDRFTIVKRNHSFFIIPNGSGFDINPYWNSDNVD